MFSNPIPFIAFRYLRARKKEGFVSVITGFSLVGIALGVATLIIVMSVMNGFRAELMGRILGLGGHINIYGLAGPLADYDLLADKIRNVPGVTAVLPVLDTQVLLTHNGMARGALVRGLKPGDLAFKPLLANKIIEGNLLEIDSDGILIGKRMAENLHVKVGDNLNLMSPAGTVTPFGTMPRSRAYPIIGIFDVGMFEYDSNFIYMPLDRLQKFVSMEGRVNTIEITTKDANALNGPRAAITQITGGTVRVQDWQQVNSSYFNALKTERNVMFLILTLIILIAAFNIISGLIMLVKDKGRDIAILRTMGASRWTVMKIFLLTGSTIGVVGTLSGLILGVAFALNIESIREFLQHLTGTDLFSAEIYFLSQLPARLDWQQVLGICGMALSLSFAATIYPAWRAARLEPVEALRYE